MGNEVLQEIKSLLGENKPPINEETPLLGDNRVLDSMALVELCLRLEDRASQVGFDFDWTSEKAMSVTQGMFRNVLSLQEEFDRQRLEYM